MEGGVVNKVPDTNDFPRRGEVADGTDETYGTDALSFRVAEVARLWRSLSFRVAEVARLWRFPAIAQTLASSATIDTRT